MKPIIFNIDMNRHKPETIRHKNAPCPFCNRADLKNILETKGNIIWLMNKYPILQDTWQTVIIESNNCQGEFSTMPTNEVAEILEFSITRWLKVIASNKFKSVALYKNFGPNSGGSIRHPHSQIIGFEKINCCEKLTENNFLGATIYEEKGLKLTISKDPFIGFLELNCILQKDFNYLSLAKGIQGILQFLFSNFSALNSYNIYFYKLDNEKIYVKIIPRFITSPLFLGYGIKQIVNNETYNKIVNKAIDFLKDRY